MPKTLLVDDNDKFRKALVNRLQLRGHETLGVDNGEDAIKHVRADSDIDVVILDRKMPGMMGEQVLKEIKEFRPEVQVIMLTGHSTMESAMETGRLEAYSYLQKPYDFDELVRIVDSAREDKVHAMARHEIPHVERGSVWKWLLGSHNSRPGIILLGLVLFSLVAFTPIPDRMLLILSSPKTGQPDDANFGYSAYRKMKEGETVAEYYSRSANMEKTVTDEAGNKLVEAEKPERVAFKAKVMLGVLVVAALFWGSGAIPVGITALVVGTTMYFFQVLRPDAVVAAHAKDAVFFIFGVLALSQAISKTGLDRRIGLLLLGPAKTLRRLMFLFLPLLAVTCSFLSQHALIAFLMPLFMMVYVTSTRAAGVKKDKSLAVMFALALAYTTNIGGPGSPVAGGRNAIMVAILADYGNAPTFGEWVMYGMPFVPVMALVIAAYFYFVFRNKLAVRSLDVAAIVRRASEKIGPMNKKEYFTAAILILVLVLWITSSDTFGMGGPVILGLVLLNIFRVLRWRDVASIHWEVVALYASASALGKGLADTGGALYLADSFLSVLPESMQSGSGLAIASSLFTGITTNFMSDGATVSAIGPITVPMATISGTHVWMVGLATAFASSFAHMLIIGTPSNAIAFAMTKDPVTGEQLVGLGDFFKHGFIVVLLSFAVLWLWTILGYWVWIGF